MFGYRLYGHSLVIGTLTFTSRTVQCTDALVYFIPTNLLTVKRLTSLFAHIDSLHSQELHGSYFIVLYFSEFGPRSAAAVAWGLGSRLLEGYKLRTTNHSSSSFLLLFSLLSRLNLLHVCQGRNTLDPIMCSASKKTFIPRTQGDRVHSVEE